MSNADEKQEHRGFKVEDRRRFSDTGEARADRPDEPAEQAAQGAFEPQSAGAAGAPHPAAGHEQAQLDLNFSTFVISLSTQALAHLGEIPHPIDNQTAVDLGAAKQLIDILGILKEKTKGNLDKAEAGLLDSILYDLRLRYVEHVRTHP